jgi:hypothetical protein
MGSMLASARLHALVAEKLRRGGGGGGGGGADAACGELLAASVERALHDAMPALHAVLSSAVGGTNATDGAQHFGGCSLHVWPLRVVHARRRLQAASLHRFASSTRHTRASTTARVLSRACCGCHPELTPTTSSSRWGQVHNARHVINHMLNPRLLS